MTAFTSAGYAGGGSPNRADALVWALTDLCCSPMRGEGLFNYYRESTPRWSLASGGRRRHQRHQITARLAPPLRRAECAPDTGSPGRAGGGVRSHQWNPRRDRTMHAGVSEHQQK
jgi:hypothetical protein